VASSFISFLFFYIGTLILSKSEEKINPFLLKDLPSATRNPFEKGFLDLLKLLFFYFIKVNLNKFNQQQRKKTNVKYLKKYETNKLLVEVFGPTFFQKGVAPQALTHRNKTFIQELKSLFFFNSFADY
jgi:hypothetical protein